MCEMIEHDRTDCSPIFDVEGLADLRARRRTWRSPPPGDQRGGVYSAKLQLDVCLPQVRQLFDDAGCVW